MSTRFCITTHSKRLFVHNECMYIYVQDGASGYPILQSSQIIHGKHYSFAMSAASSASTPTTPSRTSFSISSISNPDSRKISLVCCPGLSRVNRPMEAEKGVRERLGAGSGTGEGREGEWKAEAEDKDCALRWAASEGVRTGVTHASAPVANKSRLTLN